MLLQGGVLDTGGESIKMRFMSIEEANELDAQEFNSKAEFGVREEDLVTFLQVPLPSISCTHY